MTSALAGYVKIKFQAENPDEPPAKEVMQRLGSVGLPTYVILRPRSAGTAGIFIQRSTSTTPAVDAAHSCDSDPPPRSRLLFPFLGRVRSSRGTLPAPDRVWKQRDELNEIICGETRARRGCRTSSPPLVGYFMVESNNSSGWRRDGDTGGSMFARVKPPRR